MRPGRRETPRLALRLALWLPILFWMAWAGGWHYGQFFLPLYREVLDLALPDFGVVKLEIGRSHEYVFKAQVIAERIMVREGGVLPAGFTVDAHTPLYVALIHPIVLAAAALIWPGLSWRRRLLRMTLSLPFLVLLEALDVPLVLASSVNDLLTFSLNPQADAASALIDWVHVMDGGGRFALSIAAAAGVAGLHCWLLGMRSVMPEAEDSGPRRPGPNTAGP